MYALASLVDLILQAIFWLILIRILLSWLPMAGIQIDPYNPVVRWLIQFTDFFLEPFRRLIPPVGGLDLSPIIAILVIQFIGNLIVQALVAAA